MTDTHLPPELLAAIRTMEVRGVDHLPVVAAYCNAIHLQDIVNGFVDTRMEVKPGAIVQAMVLDTLSGRSPLYHLESFMDGQDIELLLGEKHDAHEFSDTNLGRALDAIFAAGASNMLTEIALSACRAFGIDCSRLSFDTTSISVWGEYANYDKAEEKTVEAVTPKAPRVTYGHSKDHNPDLKQVMAGLLCVERGVPIFGRCLDGNSSDKTNNNKMLTRISSLMARHGLGPGAFTYVADSALVNGPNLELLSSMPFVTRLPGIYQECARVIGEAVDAGEWVELGALSELPSPASRPCAEYRVVESEVELYGIKYRALVVHSDSHDRRMQKRLEKAVNASRQNLEKMLRGQELEFFCQADAEKAAEALRRASDPMHTLAVEVTEKETKKRGRPPKNGKAQTQLKYILKTEIRKNEEGVKREEERAGCFVLLTNIPGQGDGAMGAKDVFLAYKGQYGVESNFAFLKDPLIVNDMFLKKAERIDVLGVILIIALLVWRLIERSMRNHLANTGGTLVGLNRQLTKRPTAYAMSTKFWGLQIMLVQGTRILARGMRKEVPAYLEALGLAPEVFTTPGYECKPILKT